MTDDQISADTRPLRDRLRELPVFPVQSRSFDTDAAPSSPYLLLLTWLDEAIAGQVAQPHAMTLATADVAGQPSARTLLLKDVCPPTSDVQAHVDEHEGLWFATLSDSPKGTELAHNPRAALTFYWREQGRQIRALGRVEAGPRAVSDGDFLARGFNARALAMTGDQSALMPDADDVRRSIHASREFLAGNPLFVPSAWTAYRVIPERIEFWQATESREQVRLRYTRSPDGWTRESLWP